MKASNLESLVIVTKFQLLPSVSRIFLNFNIILTMFSSLKDIIHKNIKLEPLVSSQFHQFHLYIGLQLYLKGVCTECQY